MKNEETSVKFFNIEINLDTVVANIKDITKEVDLHKLQLDVLKDDVYNYSQLADGLEETVMYMQSDVSACCFTLQLLRWNTCVDVLHDSMETSLNHSHSPTSSVKMKPRWHEPVRIFNLIYICITLCNAWWFSASFLETHLL